MFRTLSAALIVLTSCASVVPTPVAHDMPRIKEPTRTSYIIGCLQHNLPITACVCFEEVIVKLKGTNDHTTFTDLDMAVAQQKCMEVLKPLLQEEMKDVIEEEMRKQQLKDRI